MQKLENLNGDLRIEKLNLSNRVYNCLKRAGYNTVKQIASLTEEELIKLNHLGKKGVREITEILASFGDIVTEKDIIEDGREKSLNSELER